MMVILPRTLDLVTPLPAVPATVISAPTRFDVAAELLGFASPRASRGTARSGSLRGSRRVHRVQPLSPVEKAIFSMIMQLD